MSDVKPIPDGYEGLIAHLTVDGAAGAIEFYTEAFGAEEISRSPAPDGNRILHAEMAKAAEAAFSGEPGDE